MSRDRLLGTYVLIGVREEHEREICRVEAEDLHDAAEMLGGTTDDDAPASQRRSSMRKGRPFEMGEETPGIIQDMTSGCGKLGRDISISVNTGWYDQFFLIAEVDV